MIILSSLAFACILTGALAGLITFALLIIAVEHYGNGHAGAWPDRDRTAYVPSGAFLVVSARSVRRLAAFAASLGALLFVAGLGLLMV